MNGKAKVLLGLDRMEMEELAEEMGEPRFRGRQLYAGLYARRSLDLAAMTDLSRGFRESLATSRLEAGSPVIAAKYQSRDGAVRYSLRFPDGEAAEAVYMPDKTRTTLCLSTQAGCAVACKFCFTALLGLKRNLTAGEILGQIFALTEDQKIGLRKRLNVVFMGMGEPLLNYAAVMKAFRIMSDPEGMGIPWRRITLSTSGVIPAVEKLGRETQRPKLAVSLNASNAAQRVSLMPLSRKYPLPRLLAACRAYPLRPAERMTFEYVLLDGINDSHQDALAVGRLLQGMRAKVNLIPYNPGRELPYRPSPLPRVIAFEQALRRARVPAFIRISRGQDVQGACGQLSLQS